MEYHLVLTQKCNLNCTYCGHSVEPSIMPIDLNYSLDALINYFAKHDELPVLAFYGGEPTLNLKKMFEIMDNIPAKTFMLQTNGTQLKKIPIQYLSRFNSILISIDGTEEATNQHRGKNSYERALNGGKYLRESGFSGDLIARMTVPVGSDIYSNVLHLLNLNNIKFDHVHWQLDVLWDTFFDENKDEITKWITEIYNPGITNLVNHWVQVMRDTGVILPIAPFLGITYTLLTKKISNLRCGAGKDFFSITTDGRITMCPILPSTEFEVGNIYDSIPMQLVDKIKLEEPCVSCKVKNICGGRCLYANKTKYWGDEGFDLVCLTVKHLISEITSHLSTIKTCIKEFNIDISNFEYPKIPNGVEIIP